ncbi:MAG: hypothetical protein FWG35_04010 [Spirochaetaceae bacterium]|nr:hypothetical protein [Spirochaetaceae bacterium]
MSCLLGILFMVCISAGNAQPIKSDILGELYVEKNAGFTMRVPKNWETKDFNQKYLMVIGQAENNFTPNINFGDEEFTGKILDYIEACIELFPQVFADFEVIQKGEFTTTKGVRGAYMITQGRINEIKVRQNYYVVPNKRGTAVMTIVGTAPPGGVKFDAIFAECAKTFEWTK